MGENFSFTQNDLAGMIGVSVDTQFEIMTTPEAPEYQNGTQPHLSLSQNDNNSTRLRSHSHYENLISLEHSGFPEWESWKIARQ